MVSQHFVLFSNLVLVKMNLVGVYGLLKESRPNFRNVLPCWALPAELVLPARPSGEWEARKGVGFLLKDKVNPGADGSSPRGEPAYF